VADAWDKVAERQQPAAKSSKPVLRALDRLVMAEESCAQLGEANRAADDVAQGDASQTSAHGSRERAEWIEAAAGRESAGNRQQQFVRDWQAEDAECLREEQQWGAVPYEPANELMIHVTSSIARNTSSRQGRLRQ